MAYVTLANILGYDDVSPIKRVSRKGTTCFKRRCDIDRCTIRLCNKARKAKKKEKPPP